MSLDDAMGYLIDTVRSNHQPRERTTDEMMEMYDYMVNDYMEYLHRYSIGSIPESNHYTSTTSQWKSAITFMNAISAQIMKVDNDQEAYTRRGEEISRWTR